jgi:hypothetical protein
VAGEVPLAWGMPCHKCGLPKATGVATHRPRAWLATRRPRSWHLSVSWLGRYLPQCCPVGAIKAAICDLLPVAAGGIIHAVIETPVARPLPATTAALALVMVGVGLVSCVSHPPQRTVHRGVEIDGPSNSKRLSVMARPSRRVLAGPSR